MSVSTYEKDACDKTPPRSNPPIPRRRAASVSVRAGRGRRWKRSGRPRVGACASAKMRAASCPVNRDRLGASNVGLNFCRLFRGETPMRTMSDEEREFHRVQIGGCMACDAE